MFTVVCIAMYVHMSDHMKLYCGHFDERAQLVGKGSVSRPHRLTFLAGRYICMRWAQD